jgi:hypothetical protein
MSVLSFLKILSFSFSFLFHVYFFLFLSSLSFRVFCMHMFAYNDEWNLGDYENDKRV